MPFLQDPEGVAQPQSAICLPFEKTCVTLPACISESAGNQIVYMIRTHQSAQANICRGVALDLEWQRSSTSEVGGSISMSVFHPC